MPLVRHQIWHLDDFLLIGTSKSDLKRAVRSVVRYLLDEFGLHVKPWKVSRTSRFEPLDLGGWVVRELGAVRRRPDGSTYIDESVRHTHATLRDGIFLRGTRAFRRFDKAPFLALARRCASYWGWFKHGNCEGVRIRRGIDKSMAHARRVVSASARHDRLELMEDGNT